MEALSAECESLYFQHERQPYWWGCQRQRQRQQQTKHPKGSALRRLQRVPTCPAHPHLSPCHFSTALALGRAWSGPPHMQLPFHLLTTPTANTVPTRRLVLVHYVSRKGGPSTFDLSYPTVTLANRCGLRSSRILDLTPPRPSRIQAKEVSGDRPMNRASSDGHASIGPYAPTRRSISAPGPSWPTRAIDRRLKKKGKPRTGVILSPRWLCASRQMRRSAAFWSLRAYPTMTRRSPSGH